MVSAKTLPIINLAAAVHVALGPGNDGDNISIEGINFTALDTRPTPALAECVQSVRDACETWGFFYVERYPMPIGLEKALDSASREFFRRPLDVKNEIAMKYGARAWRGYFPVGGELTSGLPDIKEGIYFGEEIAKSDPRVARQNLPLHGENLFPRESTMLKDSVLRYMAAARQIGQLVLALIALSLRLPARTFVAMEVTRDPLQLFRIFHYPPVSALPEALRPKDERTTDITASSSSSPAAPAATAEKKQSTRLWGVGEHTDYGLVTVLKQDEVGGLEVKSLSGDWISAPPMKDTLVINIGDMLEAMTAGLLRSTPHRVRNTAPEKMRLSFPYFFDPGYNAHVRPLSLSPLDKERAVRVSKARAQQGYQRWDLKGSSVAFSSGVYGEYLVGKVSKVFPALAQSESVVKTPSKL